MDMVWLGRTAANCRAHPPVTVTPSSHADAALGAERGRGYHRPQCWLGSRPLAAIQPIGSRDEVASDNAASFVHPLRALNTQPLGDTDGLADNDLRCTVGRP